MEKLATLKLVRGQYQDITCRSTKMSFWSIVSLGSLLKFDPLVLLHVVLAHLLIHAAANEGHGNGVVTPVPQRLGQLVTVHQHGPDHQTVDGLKRKEFCE